MNKCLEEHEEEEKKEEGVYAAKEENQVWFGSDVQELICINFIN